MSEIKKNIPHRDDCFTLHQLVDHLTDYLKLTPEQQFRVTARIKRYVHYEKASIFDRYTTYGEGAPIFAGNGVDARLIGHELPANPWLHKIMEAKYEQHSKMANELTDEELVTWNVGTHKFVQEKPSCCLCSQKITAGYLTVREGDKSTHTCEPCARRAGLWGEDESF